MRRSWSMAAPILALAPLAERGLLAGLPVARLADRTSLQLVYGLAGGWALLTAIGSRFLAGYRAIPVQSDEG